MCSMQRVPPCSGYAKKAVFTDLSTAVERSERPPSLVPIESGGRWSTSISAAAIRGEQGLEFSALRPVDGLPASQQQPAFPATVLAHDRARPTAFLAAHVVEHGAG